MILIHLKLAAARNFQGFASYAWVKRVLNYYHSKSPAVLVVAKYNVASFFAFPIAAAHNSNSGVLKLGPGAGPGLPSDKYQNLTILCQQEYIGVPH
jgi:hypothetical protein